MLWLALLRKVRRAMTKPRIVVADDHPVMLAMLGSILGQWGDVVAVVTDGDALVEAAQLWQPDLIISDISMPRRSGLEATRTIQHCAPQSKVIILTVHREALYLSLAFQAGARGYLLKQSALAELPRAILRVLEGDRYVGTDVAGRDAWLDADRGEVPTHSP